MKKDLDKRIEKKFEDRIRKVYNTFDDKILNNLLVPLKLRFRISDLLQVIVGASILAIPVGFTEETWRLGEVLPLNNIIALMLLSLIFISAFVYHMYYQQNVKGHWPEFVKRVLSTYIFSFLVVALLLWLIEKAPFGVDNLTAFKRIVIVGFPASMSAAVADTIR